MKRILMCAVSVAILCLTVVCLLWWRSYRESHAVYDGRRVTRKLEWYGYGLGSPLRKSLYAKYYVYEDQPGHWVKQGPYVEYYPNGNVRLENYYVDDQQNGKESIFNEAGIETLRIYWQQNKNVGYLRCPCVDP